MHSDPQISLHAIAPPFSSSRDAKIHRLCRAKVAAGFARIELLSTRLCRVKVPGRSPRIGSPSTPLCTAQLIRLHLSDKMSASTRDEFAITLDKTRFSLQKHTMTKALSILLITVAATIVDGCANNPLGGTTAQSPAAQRDYQLLSGMWQLTRAVDNGKPVPASEARNTILVTDRNTFRFPKATRAGTSSAGHFTINPDTRPKQVDSIAEGGPSAGQASHGIYEIPDPTHQRACFGPPGGPRPTGFKSPPGSGRILQYWKKIGPVPPR
jgi:uncharacterized protein (TIGR03067 family)